MRPSPVFDELVGQAAVAALLTAAAQAAAAEHRGEPTAGMTHAWLFTGPPGSGRSVAARGFAAALQCPDSGCGRCRACATVRAGSHPDVDLVVPEGLHLSINQARAVVARSARAPSLGRWQVTVIEDVDRMEERTSNTLLRALEEPPPRAVFCLCAPSPEDVLPTIRSRCRQVRLRIPPSDSVVAVLVERDGIDPAIAAFAGQASGGHVGRARRLAGDENARRRRHEVLQVPLRLVGVPASVAAADTIVAAADEEAAALTTERAQRERSALEEALGATGSRRPRGSAGALRELADEQRSRVTRAKRDALDRALLDLAGFYRDVLAVQFADGEESVPLSCPDARAEVTKMAAVSTPSETLGRLEAILACRTAIEANVGVALAVTALMVEVRRQDGGRLSAAGRPGS